MVDGEGEGYLMSCLKCEMSRVCQCPWRGVTLGDFGCKHTSCHLCWWPLASIWRSISSKVAMHFLRLAQ